MEESTVKRQLIAIATGCIAAVFLAGPAAADNVTTIRWGPIVLPAAGPNGPGQVDNEVAGVSGLSALLIGLFQSVASYDVPRPCGDCYITQIQPNLVLADGTTANFNNGTMLHHVVNVNYSRPDITCRPNLFSSQPIKALGVYSVPVRLHAEVRPEIKVWVIKQD